MIKVLFAIAGPLIMSSYMIAYNMSETDSTINVEKKERIMVIKEGKSKFKYAVYSDNEVFHLEDAWSLLHFSTLDVYNQLQESKTCEVTTAGWRVPFLSMTKNIVDIKTCG